MEDAQPFSEAEVKNMYEELRGGGAGKASGPEDIISDELLLGGEPVFTYLAKTYNECL